MGWDNLEEELCEEFESLAYAPEETMHRAFGKQLYGDVSSGFRTFMPCDPRRRQDRRQEGKARFGTCKECGGSMEGRRADAHFCGLKCKNRYGQRQWLQNHPEWKPKSRAAGPVTRPCAHCGKKMELGFRKTKQLYCDHNCAHKAYYARKKKERPEDIVEARRRFNERKRLQKELERTAA